MFHFANRRGTAGSGIREHFSSVQKESCTQPSAGIILIAKVTWSVILMQLKSQKVNKTIPLKKKKRKSSFCRHLGRAFFFFHCLVVAIPAWPFENKGNFYRSFRLVFKCFSLTFCTELKLHAKVCPSNTVTQTRGKTSPHLPFHSWCSAMETLPKRAPRFSPEGAYSVIPHQHPTVCKNQ